MLPAFFLLAVPNSWSFYMSVLLFRILQPIFDILIDLSWSCLPTITGYNVFIIALNIFHFIFVLKTVFKMFGYDIYIEPNDHED